MRGVGGPRLTQSVAECEGHIGLAEAWQGAGGQGTEGRRRAVSQGVHEAPSGQVAVSSPGEPWVEKWGGRTTPEQTGTSGAPELRFQVHRGGHGQQTGPRE